MKGQHSHGTWNEIHACFEHIQVGIMMYCHVEPQPKGIGVTVRMIMDVGTVYFVQSRWIKLCFSGAEKKKTPKFEGNTRLTPPFGLTLLFVS